jgi:hypothetical protein
MGQQYRGSGRRAIFFSALGRVNRGALGNPNPDGDGLAHSMFQTPA